MHTYRVSSVFYIYVSSKIWKRIFLLLLLCYFIRVFFRRRHRLNLVVISLSFHHIICEQLRIKTWLVKTAQKHKNHLCDSEEREREKKREIAAVFTMKFSSISAKDTCHLSLSSQLHNWFVFFCAVSANRVSILTYSYVYAWSVIRSSIAMAVCFIISFDPLRLSVFRVEWFRLTSPFLLSNLLNE